MPKGPNVILIVFDTARADAFEPYGAAPGSSPTVAQLASRGRAVPDTFSTCNWTMPSHASMFTGLLPRTAGLSDLPGGEEANCRVVLESHRDRLLPEVLRQAGYQTIGASTNLWVSKRLGFATGFDEFHDLIGKRVARMHKQDRWSKLLWYGQALLARVDDGLHVVEEQTQRWLSEHDGKTPFFWFMNLIECHSPYLPPRPYNDLGPLERLRAARNARAFQTLPGVWRACVSATPPPPPDRERMHHLYGRAVRFMDDWLARLCERLDRRGMLDDTLIVVTSDHGENFGEGDLWGHSISLDDRLVRVPLVMAGPDVDTNGSGVTSLASLPRMIASTIGLDEHPWREEDVPSGPAVAQYDTGITPDHPRVGVFREWNATPERFRRFTEQATCATDGRHKLFVLGEEETLYDLAADPLEVAPIALDPATRARPEIAALAAAIERAKATEWWPDVDRLEKDTAAASDTSDLEDRMRLLGYL